MIAAFAATGLAAALFAAPPPAVENRIASFVSREKALATVRELVALGPRMGGTASGDRAAAAVAGHMRELGLSVELLEDPPIRFHEERLWQVALGDRRLASAWPYGFSPTLAPTTAPLVIEPETPGTGAPDMKGAVVLTGRQVRQAYQSAVAAGAVALLTDTPGDPNRYQDWAPIGSLERMTATAAGAASAIPVFGLSYNEGRLLRGAGAAARVTIALESAVGRASPRTVTGMLPGAGPASGDILMICAHGDSDSGGPGADDNASGVATVLEVARALTGAAAAGLLPKERPSVTFVVWGSEYHSTQAWVTTHADAVGRLRAVINFDQTGVGAERDAVYYEGDDIPAVAPLLRVIESVADDHAGDDGFPRAYTSVPAQGGTDAYVFLPKSHRGLGLIDRPIPATTIFTAAWDKPGRLARTKGWSSKGWPDEGEIFVDYSPVYHSSGDTPERTTEKEPWNMERCARLTALAVFRLMGRAPAAAPQTRP